MTPSVNLGFPNISEIIRARKLKLKTPFFLPPSFIAVRECSTNVIILLSSNQQSKLQQSKLLLTHEIGSEKNSRPHSVDQNSGSLQPGSLLTSLRVDCTITTIALDLYSCIEYKTTNITWLLLKLTKCLITTLLYYVLSTATIVCSACCHIFQVAIDH